MKKTTIKFLSSIIFLLVLTSCNPPKTTLSPDYYATEHNYLSLFRPHYYYSPAKMYEALRDWSEEDLYTIRENENRYIDDTTRRTHVLEAERESGIFGTFRNSLLENETLMYPYYQGVILPNYDDPYITLQISYSYRKPWIAFTSNSIGISVYTMYYDRALVEEANKKGASWLLSIIEPNGVNVNSYIEDHQPMIGWAYVGKDISIFNKTYQLGDREVMAMVIDSKNNLGDPLLRVYFVYDDMLVYIDDHAAHVEEFLPHLTFREVHLPTGEPVRDTPGRAWSEGGVDEE